VLVSITVAGVILAQDWQKVHVRSAGGLVLSTLFGIPVGLVLLTSGHQKSVKVMLSAIILAFAIYSLLGRQPPELKSDNRIWLSGCGFLAGILGGAYGMNGPPLVIYGALRRWPAQHFRATLQAYFLPASILGMLGYWLTGLWTPGVTRYYLESVVPALAAILLGRIVNRRLRGEKFFKYLYLGLAAVGASLLFQTVTSG
jgi:hypothetical protein